MNKKQLAKAYYAGVREGIEKYAHWKDGVQYVGTCGRTLEEALKDVNDEELQSEELITRHEERRKEIRAKFAHSRIGLNNV